MIKLAISKLNQTISQTHRHQKCSRLGWISVAVILACMMFSVYFSESLHRLLSVLCLISSSEKEKETGKKRIGNKRVE